MFLKGRRFPFLLVMVCTLLFATTSCKKDKEIEDFEPVVEETTYTVEGTFVIPVGSSLEQVTLEVVSPMETRDLDGSSHHFEVQVPDDDGLTMLIVDDKEGNIHGLGYYFPGSSATTVDARSTTIAMLLMGGWSFDLSESARMEILDTLQGKPGFESLVQQVDQIMSEGNGLFPNGEFPAAFAFESFINWELLSRTQSRDFEFEQQGNTLKFVNGLAVTYVVNVEDPSTGASLEQIVVPGYTPLALSLGDILTFDVYKDPPVPPTYTLPNNGSRKFTATNGLASDLLSNPAAQEALMKNFASFLWKAFNAGWPGFKKFMDQQCIASVIDGHVSYAVALFSANPPQNTQQMVGLMINVLNTIVSSQANTIFSCVELEGSVSKWMQRILTVIDIASRFENAFNGGNMIVDMMLYSNTYNYCVTMDNGTASDCEIKLSAPGVSVIGLNDCLTGVGTGSSSNLNFQLENPLGNEIDYIRCEWYATGCTDQANSGVFDAPIVLNGSNAAYIEVCSTFGDCSGFDNYLTAFDIEGNASNTILVRQSRPSGAERTGGQASTAPTGDPVD